MERVGWRLVRLRLRSIRRVRPGGSLLLRGIALPVGLCAVFHTLLLGRGTYGDLLSIRSEPDVDAAVPRARAPALALGEEPIVAACRRAGMIAAQGVGIVVPAVGVIRLVATVVIFRAPSGLLVVSLVARLLLLVVSARVLGVECRRRR